MTAEEWIKAIDDTLVELTKDDANFKVTFTRKFDISEDALTGLVDGEIGSREVTSSDQQFFEIIGDKWYSYYEDDNGGYSRQEFIYQPPNYKSMGEWIINYTYVNYFLPILGELYSCFDYSNGHYIVKQTETELDAVHDAFKEIFYRMGLRPGDVKNCKIAFIDGLLVSFELFVNIDGTSALGAMEAKWANFSWQLTYGGQVVTLPVS